MWEGVASLLQYHYRIPHMEVQKVYLECAAACHPPQAYLHQESDVVLQLLKEYMASLGLIRGVGEVLQILPVHHLLKLSVG